LRTTAYAVSTGRSRTRLDARRICFGGRERDTHTHIYIYTPNSSKFTLNERNMLEGQHIVERLKMLSTTSPGLLGAHCSFGSKEEIVGAVRHDICR
jgi:methionine synthase I (cobalamin-dependent)